MAQRALGDAQLLNAKELKHGAHEAHTAADDGFDVIAQTRQRQTVDMAGLCQLLLQLQQGGAGDQARRLTHVMQGFADGTCCA